jgi:hypothetical protein
MLQDSSVGVKCPLCGAMAEAGAIYADDRSDLRWLSGEPSWGKNVQAALAGGKRVGEYGFLLVGTHARGIYCRSCKRITIDVPEPVNYFPDVG